MISSESDVAAHVRAKGAGLRVRLPASESTAASATFHQNFEARAIGLFDSCDLPISPTANPTAARLREALRPGH